MERLNKECFLPLEWMETTINGQTLQVSHCQIKRQDKNAHFRTGPRVVVIEENQNS
jgi:type II secretory pathway component PulM